MTSAVADWRDVEATIPIASDRLDGTQIIGPAPSAEIDAYPHESAPQAFVARLGGSTGALPVHFHPVDQFQVFVKGQPRFGRERVRPGVVHYVDAYQPYGP